MIKEEVIYVDVTPKLLRTIAGDLEAAMEKAKEGDPIPFFAFRANGISVILRADQTAFKVAQEGGGWR